MEDTVTKTPTMKLLNENNLFLKRRVEELDVTSVDKEALREIIDSLHETRRQHKAVGLAANQVGINLRLFVMGTDFADFTCINPEIVSTSETRIIDKEGCLSFPGLVLKISRAAEIKVKYLDADLNEVECSFNGLFARCFQHELDHLDGITFTDRVSRLVLAMGRKKQAQSQRFR